MSDENSERTGYRSTLPIELSEEWKSHFAVAEASSAPLLIDHPPPRKRRRLHERAEEEDEHEFGPIIFSPYPKTLVQLYSSPSISPRLPPPYPRLSLTRFIKTSTPSFLDSDASAIAAEFGPQQGQDFTANLHGFNSLRLLSCESGGSSFDLAFFPTGDNCDQVGCLKICIEDSMTKSDNVRAFTANHRLYHRISNLLVNPASDFIGGCSESPVAILGYVMACTTYSANWYLVRLGSEAFGRKGVVIEFVGHCLFGDREVVNACWSPHVNEESVVLLETGELYLFDVTSCVEKKSGPCSKVRRKKLHARWDGADLRDTGGGGWVAVEFAWHSRTIIVAHASVVFMVDIKLEGCDVRCLLTIDMLDSVRNDRFLALCRAGSGFNFCVASRNLLLLCDVRVLDAPVLKWVHGLPNPCYVTAFRLSELRSNAKDDKFKWATESSSCILLGSFWNCEFSLFVYGPRSSRRSVCQEISNLSNSYYAWGLGYKFSLSANSVQCADCIVKDEFYKAALPVWVDWRQKTDLVMGFSILSRDTWAQLPETDGFGGFTMIRKMSSGKLEAMRYEAVWSDKKCDRGHLKTFCGSQADRLFDLMEEKYHLPKDTEYLKLEFLGEYLKGNLDRIVAKKMNNSHLISSLEAISDEIYKTSDSGEAPGLGSVSRIFEIFKDVNLPTSGHEIALRSIWIGMPQYLARFAFSSHTRDSQELPEAIASSWQKARLPPHFLLTLQRLNVVRVARTRRAATQNSVLHSVDDEIKLQCNRVMEVADELTRSNSETDSQHLDGYAVSLADDNDDLGAKEENVGKFAFHEPAALLDEEASEVDITLQKSRTRDQKFTAFDNFRARDDRFTKFVFLKQELNFSVDPAMDGLELLNAGCPVMLKFNARAVSFGPKELKIFQKLKKHDLDMQKGFSPYQDYISRTNLRDHKT